MCVCGHSRWPHVNYKDERYCVSDFGLLTTFCAHPRSLRMTEAQWRRHQLQKLTNARLRLKLSREFIVTSRESLIVPIIASIYTQQQLTTVKIFQLFLFSFLLNNYCYIRRSQSNLCLFLRNSRCS